jgi:NADH-quinone oxidoreductase subunit H
MLEIVLITLAKIVGIVLVFVMIVATLMTWADRKQSALIQDRVGPNRANVGPIRAAGLIHILADALKTLFKEDFSPRDANKGLFRIAPFLAFVPALLAFAVIPVGDVWCSGGKIAVQNFHDVCLSGENREFFRISGLNVGLLYIFAVVSLGVYGSSIGGWASNNKYSLIGGVRVSAQMLSYEVTMGLSLMGLLMVFQSIDLNDMVREQGQLLWGFIPKWGIVIQPLAFVLFFTAAVAETKRPPFDIPEAESELAAGYFVEYSAMKFALFTLSEYVASVLVAMMVTTLFLGGWQIPYLYGDGFHNPFSGELAWGLPYLLVKLLQVGAFCFKTIFLCWLQLMLRWTLPRFRYDQLMRLGWKVMLPLSLANLFVTAVVLLWIH